MRLDIRLPLGLLFLVFGFLLSVFGLASDQALYQRSLHVNINFWWGLVLLVFGLTMFVLGRRGHRRLRSADAGGEPLGKSASERQ
jgi:hypothetical protein